jgi:predicted NBD/HSP70 family sugar kinase
MISSALALPDIPAALSLADEALLALVLSATRPTDGQAAVRTLLRLAEEGDPSASRLLRALAHEAAVAAGCREDLAAPDAAALAGHALRALGRELRGGDGERADAARPWLLALAADAAQARAARD